MKIRLAATLATLALTACSAEPLPEVTTAPAVVSTTAAPTSAAPPETPSPSPSPSTPPELELLNPSWAVGDVQLVGSPAAVGDEAVVSYFTENNRLYLGAWSAGNGEQLWRTAAGASYEATGVTPYPAVREGKDGSHTVGAVSPAHFNGWQTFRELHALTGRELQAASYVKAQSRPHVCADGALFCIDGVVEGYDVTGSWKLEAGKLLPEPLRPLPPNSSWLNSAAGVFQTHLRPDREGELQGDEEVGYSVDSAVAWTRAVEDIFGEGVSADHGWSWSDGRDHSWPLVGMGSGPWSEDPLALNPINDVIAALDKADGSTVWRVDKAWFCGSDEEVVVACVFESGSISFPDETRTYSEVKADLRGLDPHSGAQLWTLPLSSENFLPDEAPGWVFAGSHFWVGGELVKVDLESGDATPVAEDVVLACEESRPQYMLKENDHERSYPGRDWYRPCHPDRNTAAQFSKAAVEAVGTRVGDYLVVSTEGGLTAFLVPAEGE